MPAGTMTRGRNTAGRANGVATVGRKREGQPSKIKKKPAGKFGQHLEQLMIRAGFTTAEFADRINVSVDVLNLYIKGTRQPPFKQWEKIAIALDLANLRDLVPDFPLK